jgi:hypothetical protein
MPSTTRATITNVSRRYFSKPWPVAPDSHLASFFRIAPNPPGFPPMGPHPRAAI